MHKSVVLHNAANSIPRCCVKVYNDDDQGKLNDLAHCTQWHECHESVDLFHWHRSPRICRKNDWRKWNRWKQGAVESGSPTQCRYRSGIFSTPTYVPAFFLFLIFTWWHANIPLENVFRWQRRLFTSKGIRYIEVNSVLARKSKL